MAGVSKKIIVWTMIIVCSISHVPMTSAAFATVEFNPDLDLDLFEMGSNIYSIWKDSTEETTPLIEEVSSKMKVVLHTISNPQDTVTDLFAQQALQVRLSVVEKFHRQTVNRVRELDGIVKAKESEKEKYMQLFIDGTKSSYLDALHDIIPILIGTSISSDKTLLELVRDHNRCDMTVLDQFVHFCRRMIYSGIIVEVTFKTHEYNLTLEQEKKEWGKKLQDLANAIDKMHKHCDNIFPLYYNDDIRQDTALDHLHANLERRYTNTSFFGVDLSRDEVFFFATSTPTEQLSCFKLPQCNKRRCMSYTKIGSSCKETPSLQILTSDRDLQYKLSADWPGRFFYTSKDGKRTYNLLQVDCSASFLQYPDVEMTETCVSRACRFPVSTLLVFCVLVMLRPMMRLTNDI